MKLLFPIWIVLLSLTGCSEKKDLGEISVTSTPIKKRQTKTHSQFIQIAYIDLFNKTITPQRFNRAKQIFDSQGDDDINFRLFIKQLLDDPGIILPSKKFIQKDTEKFVVESYLKFYGRRPNGYEKKLLIDDIKRDQTVSAATIYYILMTTEEYKMF